MTNISELFKQTNLDTHFHTSVVLPSTQQKHTHTRARTHSTHTHASTQDFNGKVVQTKPQKCQHTLHRASH